MNIKNNILDELETVAPTLINVPRTIPYAVQNSYFDNLSTNILNIIKAENQIVENIFSAEQPAVNLPYSLPENYFDGFASGILAKVKAEEKQTVDTIIPKIPINPYFVSGDYFETLSDQVLYKVASLNEDEIVFGETNNKITPYKVPIGYFDRLSSYILDKINEENFVIISNFTKTNPYQIPTGYFNNLSIQIFSKIKNEIGDEIVVDSFSKVNPYQIPVGYFDGLAETILAKLDIEIKLDIPEGYFETLPDIILQKVRGIEVAKELEQVAPILNTISKAPVYAVPTGYFEGLQPAARKEAAGQAKIISIKKKTNWLKNAIAACLIGTLGFSAYQLMDSSAETTSSINKASQNNVAFNLPNTNINVDAELAKVDDASLVKYLDNIEMPSEQATANFQDVNTEDVNAALHDISDEALQKHLDETGELADKKN